LVFKSNLINQDYLIKTKYFNQDNIIYWLVILNKSNQSYYFIFSIFIVNFLQIQVILDQITIKKGDSSII